MYAPSSSAAVFRNPLPNPVDPGGETRDIFRAIIAREAAMSGKSQRPSAAFGALLCLGFGTVSAHALETNDLVGRWGVAAYFTEKDAAATRVSAASACGQPYAISRGKGGNPVMYSAFTGKPAEVVIQGDRIVNADGGDPGNTKVILSADAGAMMLRYVSDEASLRYGTMVFVRCRR